MKTHYYHKRYMLLVTLRKRRSENLWKNVKKWTFVAFYSAINAAFIDLIAKNQNISLANHIGVLKNSEIDLYANFNRRTRDRSLKGIKKSVEFVRDHGFNAYKFAPFDEIFLSQSKLDFHKSLTAGLERIDVIKNEIGSLGSLSSIIGKSMSNIRNLHITERNSDFFKIELEIDVIDLEHLSKVIVSLRTSDFIENVTRI